MNDEIKQIIEDIKLTLDVTVKDMVLLNRKDIKQLLDYITNLQQINKNLTNSLNKKVEEGIKLQLKNGKLQSQLQQKDNIIKEVRKKIESVQILSLRSGKTLIATLLNDSLEILDKVGDSSND